MNKTIYTAAFVLIFIIAGCGSQPKQAAKLTVIEIYSSECGACKEVKPIVDEVEKEYSKDINVIRYDVSTPDGAENAKAYYSTHIPVFVFLDRDGKQFFKHEGRTDKELLVGILKSHL